MSQPLYPKTNELGTLKTTYENNPAYARNLLGFIILLVLAGVIVLAMGFMQNNARDRLPLMAGSLLPLALGVKVYFDFRGRLRVSAAVYDDGFVFTDHHGQRITCRWDDVTDVYETIIYRDQRQRHPRWWRYTVHRREGEPIKIDDALQRPKAVGSTIQDEVKKRWLPRATEIYKSGETVTFGPHLGLNLQGIVAGQKVLPWEDVADIRFSRQGTLQIAQKGRRGAWKVIPHPKLANPPTLKAMIHQIVQANLAAAPPGIHDPQQQPAAPAGMALGGPGSIGDLSTRLNYDVRELLMEGYSLPQIYAVLEGEYTLEELLQKKPRKKDNP